MEGRDTGGGAGARPAPLLKGTFPPWWGALPRPPPQVGSLGCTCQVLLLQPEQLLRDPRRPGKPGRGLRRPLGAGVRPVTGGGRPRAEGLRPEGLPAPESQEAPPSAPAPPSFRASSPSGLGRVCVLCAVSCPRNRQPVLLGPHTPDPPPSCLLPPAAAPPIRGKFCIFPTVVAGRCPSRLPPVPHRCPHPSSPGPAGGEPSLRGTSPQPPAMTWGRGS